MNFVGFLQEAIREPSVWRTINILIINKYHTKNKKQFCGALLLFFRAKRGLDVFIYI